MSTKMFIIRYLDRKERLLKIERVFASRFLHWLYNTHFGRITVDLIFKHKPVSQLYGWFHKLKLSRCKIKPFVQKMGLNLDELTRPINDFTSFNDFFTREIDLSKRPIDQNPLVCIAPVDGKILAYEDVATDMTFHFPDSGIAGETVPIRGKYYASGPYALRALIPSYTENYRVLTLFDSDHFGQIAMVEIGAFTVGSIQQKYTAGRHLAKGERKGFFELGGSTIVLLFEKGRIKLDEDLLANTRNDLETYVLLGGPIGMKPISK